VELRFGASVQEVLADDAGRIAGVRAAGPHGPARIAATLTVASDGRGSRLRRAVGLDVLSARYRHEFIGFELNGAKNLPPRLCAYLVRRGVVLYFPLPDDRARMYVQSEPGVYRRQHAGDPRAWLEDVLDEVPALQSWAQQVHAAAGTGRILPIWRHRATRWSLPGFALAGDSAHCVHPIAAQGMSAALDDAWVLAELLSEAEDGTETGRLRAAQVDRAIDRYSTVRKDRAEFTARLSHSLAALLTGTSPAARALRRHELRVIDSNNRLRRILVHNMSGTGVRRFTAADRLAQLGLPDPRRGRPPRLAAEPLLGTADRADLDLDFLGADR
jgi:2-polyprenyl-6-methoxyphenol hydroxylase-like FAD-dependent oxidoreductase